MFYELFNSKPLIVSRGGKMIFKAVKRFKSTPYNVPTVGVT
jgi:hypothetical protein